MATRKQGKTLKNMATKMVDTMKDSTRRRQLNVKPVAKVINEDESTSNDTETSKKSLKKIIANSLKYIVVALIIPPLLNYSALIREDKEFKKTGDMNETFVGQRLFVKCKGQGKPTVIMDGPSGTNSDIWVHVFNEVSKVSKVCVYDRAGIGFSDRPRMPPNTTNNRGTFHTTERMVDDLRFLFSNKTNHEEPFLLVGAELGAINVKFYAQMYQDDVMSLVLVNPLNEGLFALDNGRWGKFWFGQFLTSWQYLRILAVLGLNRLAFRLGLLKDLMHHENLPQDVQQRQRHLMCKPGHLYSAVEEHFFLNESLAQLRLLHKIRSLSDKIPVSIISSSKFSDSASDDINQLWSEAQKLNKNFFHENTKYTKTVTSADQTIFKDFNIIANKIKEHIQKWRTDSKKSSKY